jgi:hypothetical protein
MPGDAADRDSAAARYAATRIYAAGDALTLLAIARAHARYVAIADRLGRDLVARSTDAAAGYATLGALYDALGDAPRARSAWQAAADGGTWHDAARTGGDLASVEPGEPTPRAQTAFDETGAASDEPLFMRGLADAAARTGDGPAALVFATKAAAAWGDPAVVWTDVGAALLAGKQLPEALTAVRFALDLAGPDELDRALVIGIAASKGMGRDEQAQRMEGQRVQLALARIPRGTVPPDADLQAALAAQREHSSAATAARLWVATRAQPRDIEARAELRRALDPGDVRRAVIERELVQLAGTADDRDALAAVRALR